MGIGAGLVVGGLGTLLGAREQRRATESAVEAARFQPFSVNGPAGQVQVGADGQVNLVGNQRDQQFSDLLQNFGFGNLRAGVNAVRGMGIGGTVGGPGLRDIMHLDPRTMANQESRLLRNNAVAGLSPNMLNPMFANMATARDAQGQVAALGMGNLQNAMGFAGLQGGMGAQFLGQAGSMDINALASGRLAQLNALAQPGEDRMAAQLGDRLFASGRNATTGGAQQFGELMQAQARSDMERRIMATQFATGEQNRLIGLGQGLIGSGQNTALGAMGGQSNALGAFGNLVQGEAGLVGARNAILGQRFSQLLGAEQFGQNAAATNMGLLLGQANQNFNQRLQNSQFTLGQQESRFNRELQLAMSQAGLGEGLMGMSQSFDPFNQLMAQASLSTALSGAASGAGAQMGSFIAQGGQNRANMISSMFGGMMQGVMNND